MSLIPNAAPKSTASTPGEEEMWAAVSQGDPTADGLFFYGVRTTGIFCRPSCTSRRPLRENVAFFATAGEAEAAGFRACKRCQPTGSSISEQQAEAVAKACRILEAEDAPLKLADLARRVGMSSFHFQRIFSRVTGLTPKAYAQGCRSEKVRRELESGRSVTEAIYEAGYQSSGAFYAQSSQLLGMKPRDLQRGGAGLDIRFTVAPCSLGFVLVASSPLGICAILLEDESAVLVEDLRRRFPKANLIPATEDFTATVAEVITVVENPGLALTLPLDVRGTVFQQKVWQALREIPTGRTATYTEVAARIGQPQAVRAVALACGANALAVAIPCHRVLRADGGLAGYRWGMARKKALLERERKTEA